MPKILRKQVLMPVVVTLVVLWSIHNVEALHPVREVLKFDY